jgi:hypothetical protein
VTKVGYRFGHLQLDNADGRPTSMKLMALSARQAGDALESPLRHEKVSRAKSRF